MHDFIRKTCHKTGEELYLSCQIKCVKWLKDLCIIYCATISIVINITAVADVADPAAVPAAGMLSLL